MNIEQGMSKEEVHGLSLQMATRKLRNYKDGYKLMYLRI